MQVDEYLIHSLAWLVDEDEHLPVEMCKMLTIILARIDVCFKTPVTRGNAFQVLPLKRGMQMQRANLLLKVHIKRTTSRQVL